MKPPTALYLLAFEIIALHSHNLLFNTTIYLTKVSDLARTLLCILVWGDAHMGNDEHQIQNRCLP